MRSAVLMALLCAGCHFSVEALQGVGGGGVVDNGDLAVAADLATTSDPRDLGGDPPGPIDLATTAPADLTVDPCAGAPPLATGAIGAQCVIGQPPTIDGDLSDWPLGSFIAMTRKSAAQAVGWGQPSDDDDADSSARFFVRWDLTYLYVAASISDDIRSTPNNPPGLSDNDAFELFLDGNHDRTTSYGSDDWQLVYSADQQKAAARGTGVTWPAGTKENWGGIAPGFTLEVAIPWSVLGGTAAAPGRVVGLDLKLDDNDSAKKTRDRDLIMYYVTPQVASTCAAPYCRTDVFGAVQLQGR